MYYPVGYNRSLMIFLLVTYVMQVVGATPLEFPATTEPGPPSPPPANSSTPSPYRLLEAARRAAASLLRDTARVSDKVLWNAGKMLLSAGGAVNHMWDAALHASVRLLKVGGAACGSVAGRLAHVPIIGFGASGVSEAVNVAVDAVARNVAHDTLVRSQALAALNAKLDESGARLRPATAGETGGPAPAAGPVTFFPRE
ncbi:uncharacterized protein LOC132927136 isoform X2 [Rhopalosiphum padi]|uniref:uncharacterized protein LOC132927136 isoform X2 n=1 Tax=Rhopalosiphum padi TaxID=40932 RepID=UPI00298EC290|nr:uncharacterized protein LOC132927136 isoform X2 [Rhopalosiphum padi]